MSFRLQLAIPALVCLLLAVLGACRPPEPIRIGFLGGLTGRAAGLGASGRNGFLLTIEQANASGGVHGRRIEAVVGDDHMDAGQAVTALQELYGQKVAAVVGPMTSRNVSSGISPATCADADDVSASMSAAEPQSLITGPPDM